VRVTVMHAAGDVGIESVPDPTIVEPTDAVIRITWPALRPKQCAFRMRTALCSQRAGIHQGDGPAAGMRHGHQREPT